MKKLDIICIIIGVICFLLAGYIVYIKFFKENKIEILEVILKYSELFSSIYNKILILSSLCDKYYKDSMERLHS